MFNKIYSYLLVLTIMLICSCKKDLGNYDYNPINELSEFGGVVDTVAIYGERFTLNPALLFTQDQETDTTRYSYEWTYIGANLLGGSEMVTFAKTRNLDQNMNLVAGTYDFFYGVTDKTTGVKYRKAFKLTVQNEINEGWLLMSDVNGAARLDILSKKADGSFVTINDLLDITSSGLTLQGKPKMIYTYNKGVAMGVDNIAYGIYLGTDQYTTKVDPNTFKWTKNMDITYEMFGEIPANFHVDQIKQSGSDRSYMMGKDNVYLYDRAMQYFYSTPINYIEDEKKKFSVAPFIAADEVIGGEKPCILYDATNRRFVKHVGLGGSCTVIPNPPVDAESYFNFSTGMDMVYMSSVKFSGTEVQAILKDPTSSKRFLAKFDSSNNKQSYYGEILATDFANAEFFAFSPSLPYIFYNVGSKVYEYDTSLKTTKLVLDKGAEKISLLKFQVFRNETKYMDGSKLIVCSYDPALPEGTNGKMEQFTVPNLNEDLVLDNTFIGFGKVIDLSYRER